MLLGHLETCVQTKEKRSQDRTEPWGTPTERSIEEEVVLAEETLKVRWESSRIELGDVTPHNIKQLKRLNQVIFPVSYNDKFYKDVLEVGELAKLAYFNDIAVGAVCCRVDHSQNQKRLYIMTLGCLAPYRRLGIGTKMLNHVLNICEKDGTFDNIYLHVQISNESAIDFYRKFGFEIIETKKNYYKRIEPADAHVLQKNLKLSSPAGQNADVQQSEN
ncbi:N-alpha-acetyltransferase 50 isoform X1 [Ascaphus truei]|uniref:N-alpha-acetyltransferase 50 isoform X1 n=1 Tax=Ascaphus truei TaxID=8439 RepID=UPI003F5A9E1C